MSVSPSISQRFIPQRGKKGDILLFPEANGNYTGPDRPPAQEKVEGGGGGGIIFIVIDAWKCDYYRLLLSIPAAGLLAFVL
jgi:hypothetical protein